MAHPWPSTRAGELLARGLIASVLLAGGRGALAALRYVHGAGALSGYALRDSLAELLATALRVAPAVALVLLLAQRAIRRGRPALLVLPLVALPAWLHLTHRFPGGAPALVPGLESAPGRLVNAALGLVALGAAWAALPALVLPARRWLAGGAGIGLLAGAGLLVATRPAPARWPQRPNLILISIDTLRADHLGCYGYELPTSPALDRLALRSTRFDRAYSSDAWTLTAHMTMLTGLNPLVHGVDREVSLSPLVPTLPELLSQAGYATFGVVDRCVWLHPRYGFRRGFDVYRPVEGDAPHKVREALELVDHRGDAPFFLFAHFYDVHSDWDVLPYDAAPEDRAAFTSWYQGDFQPCDPSGLCASEYLQALNRRGEVLDPQERRYLASLYDSGIRTLDRRLQDFFDALDERGLFETSVVVLTADHGEEFFEHGQCLHSSHHDECIRVPLLVRTPETTGSASAALASLEDLTPTLLDYAGLPPADVQGRSLRSDVEGRVGGAQRRCVITGRRGMLHSLRDGEWTLVRDGQSWSIVGPAGEMSLEEAPPVIRERLLAWADEERRSAARLAARFAGGQRTGPLSAREQGSLRALGYGGGDE